MTQLCILSQLSTDILSEQKLGMAGNIVAVVLLLLVNCAMGQSGSADASELESWMSIDQSKNPCSRVLPGLDRMAKGVDLTKLDLYHDFGADGEDGFQRRVLDYNCKGGKKYTIGKEAYDVPDEFEDVDPLPAGAGSSSSAIMTSRSELKKVMSTEVGFGVGSGKSKDKESTEAPGGSLSASATYKATSESIDAKRNEILINKMTAMSAKAKLDPVANLMSSVSSVLLLAIQQLPEKFNIESAAQYMNFFREFGTHFFAEANLGGVISSITHLDNWLTKNMDETTIKANAELKLAKYSGSVKHKRVDTKSSRHSMSTR